VLREVFRVTDGKERRAERSVEPEVIRRRATPPASERTGFIALMRFLIVTFSPRFPKK
jgi:hypothetical protein